MTMSWSAKNPPPPRVIKAYQDGLKKFIDPSDRLSRVFSEVYPGHHQVHQVKHEALEVFSLGLRHIWKEGKKRVDSVEEIKNVRSVGWRFVAADAAVAGACHVSESPDGKTATLMGVSRVRELATVFTLLDAFEKMEKIIDKKNEQAVEYDRVVLRVPGLVEAFWLRSKPASSDKDLVVPFHTRIKDDQGPIQMRDFTLKQFMQILFDIARQRLTYTAEEG
jgi:hypothetical protein